MPFPTKIQLIKRKSSEQWYVNFPAAIAQSMDFSKGESVHWSIHDRSTLVLTRPDAPPSPLKKEMVDRPFEESHPAEHETP